MPAQWPHHRLRRSRCLSPATLTPCHSASAPAGSPRRRWSATSLTPMSQIPHAFFPEPTRSASSSAAGGYSVETCSCARSGSQQIIHDIYAQNIKKEEMTILGWRNIPSDNSHARSSVKPTRPVRRQVFIGRGNRIESEDEFEHQLYILRKIDLEPHLHPARHRLWAITRCRSCRTVVYKGMFLADQLGTCYRFCAARISSARSRSCTSGSRPTRPAWSLAHPSTDDRRNGEIDTLRGNNNWIAARPASVSSPLFGDDVEKSGRSAAEASRTRCFDDALEFLTIGGYSLAHAVMMVVPEAWAGDPLMDQDGARFTEYDAGADRTVGQPRRRSPCRRPQIGATLDRNRLRPARCS